jgi:RNA polymerase sigma-70 factor (ECF subfamily)
MLSPPRSSTCQGRSGANVGLDFSACAEAFRAEFDYLYRTVLRHGVAPQDAEDAVQNVFLTMWRRWGEYDQTRPLRPWLAGIAARSAHRRRRRREAPVGVPTAIDGARDPEQQLLASRARALVMAALAALPDRHRAMVVMHDLDDLSVTDIARVHGVSVQTASARVRSARNAFAKVVRRLTNTAALGRMALVAPPQLLAFERLVPPAPETIRWRALARARATPANAGPADFPPPSAGPAPLLIRIFGAALAVIATVTMVHQRSARRPRPRTAALVSAPQAPRLVSPLRPTSDRSGPAAADPPEALAHFPFDESPGASTVRDASGGGNDCQLHDVDGWVPGVRGRAIALGGRGWLACPQVERLRRLTGEITVAAWIRPRSRWGAQTIVARQKGSDRADDLFFGLVNDRLLVRSRTFRKQLDRPLPSTFGDWIHVAFTRQADGTLSLYAGGALLGQNKGRPVSIGGGSSPLTIGGSLNGPDPAAADEFFAGEIDEVVMFGRALSPAEVGGLAIRPSAPAASATSR